MSNDHARISLDDGAEYPYDGGADFWDNRHTAPPPATDWAHAAARGVLADLQSRGGIGAALDDPQIDHQLRAQITQALADIIRLAHKKGRP